MKRVKSMKSSHKLHLLVGNDLIFRRTNIKRMLDFRKLLNDKKQSFFFELDDIMMREVYIKKVEPDGWLYLKLSIDY